jgi:NNP family nitrate/nitrite transporter-like MFS transporter
VDAFKFAFIGPLLAALVRPIGGWLSDRIVGGAIITFWSFLCHGGGVILARWRSCQGVNGGGNVVGFVRCS